MSTIPVALSTGACSAIATIFRDLLPQRLRNFRPVARNRERIIDASNEIRNESVEEMLLAVSTALRPNLSNDIGEMQVQNTSRGFSCLFGDWPAELWASPSKDGSLNHAEN